MVKEARGGGGGTIPPHMFRELKQMDAKSGGLMNLIEGLEVSQIEWIHAPKQQQVTSPPPQYNNKGLV